MSEDFDSSVTLSDYILLDKFDNFNYFNITTSSIKVKDNLSDDDFHIDPCYCVESLHPDTFKAAQNGHLECLDYAYKNGGFLTDSVLTQALKYGHIDCINYILSHHTSIYDDTYCYYIAKNGCIPY